MIAETTLSTFGLTPQEKRVADAYIETQSYQKAGEMAGYGVKYARTSAYRSLHKSHVKEYVEGKLAELRAIEDKRLTPERIKAKIAEKAFDDTLRPEAQLKALELAGKATPGTFDQPTQQSSTVNLLAILNNLGIMHPPARANAPVAATVITTSPVESVTDQTIPPSVEGSNTPHEGSVSENTPTQKFVDQK